MKKLISLLSAIILISALLTSCSSDEEAQGLLNALNGASGVQQSTEAQTGENSPAAADSTAVQTTEPNDVTESNDYDDDSEQTITGLVKVFSSETMDGGVFNFEDISQYDLTVINFWATFCGPCIQEMPDLADFYDQLPSNVNFVTYCLDYYGNEGEAESILEEADLHASVIVDADGDLGNVAGQVMYIPTTIFIDRNGNIVGKEIIGGQNDVVSVLNQSVQKALAEAGR